MKRSFILVSIIMLLVATGCNAPAERDEQTAAPPLPPPPPSTVSAPAVSNVSVNAGGLTLENYEKIENGMSHQDVAALLGSGGEETRRSNIENIELKSFKWKGDSYKRVYVNFRDGKVNSKAQTGLK